MTYYGLTLRRLVFWLALILFLIGAGIVFAQSYAGNLHQNQEIRELDSLAAPPLFIQKHARQLAAIRKCESGDRHYDNNGNIIVSRTGDVGMYQVNLKSWQKEAERLGYDIWTPDGNEQMAYHILATQGLRAWVCWKK